MTEDRAIQVGFIGILLLLLMCALVGCNETEQKFTPAPPPSNQFTSYYGVGVQVCDDFTFGEPHYCLKSIPARMGQTITMTFTVEGNLYPADTSMNPPGSPATLRLFAWRRGDNLSCAGAFQGYRQWSSNLVELTPGQHTISVVLAPENFTDCYGHHGDLQGILNDPMGLGFTFGGSDAGHGVRSNGPGHFHLDSFVVQ